MRIFERGLSIAVAISLMVMLFCTHVGAAEIIAAPTKSSVYVDGALKLFQAYTIGGSNYFKLRDLAYALGGTGKQFDVSYDAPGNTIVITTGKAYTPIGGELSGPGGCEPLPAALSNAAIKINGNRNSVTAYTIGGFNYFKLRDIAKAIDFGVTYNEKSGQIDIKSTIEYWFSLLKPATNNVEGFSNYFTVKNQAYRRVLNASQQNDIQKEIVSKDLLNASLTDLTLIVFEMIGQGSRSLQEDLEKMGLKDINITFDGNDFTTTFTNKDGKSFKLTCHYDPVYDQLTAKSYDDTGSLGMLFEYTNLGDYTYASQY